MLTPYKLIILLTCTMFILDRVRKRVNNEPRQSTLKLLATIIVWGGLIVITIVPSLYTQMIKFLGAENDKNSLMIFGFFILLILIYKILSIIERIEKNITDLVRDDSLRDIIKKK